MKVIDILKQACAYLSLYNDYKQYFEPSYELEIENELSIPVEKQEELELLLLCVNNNKEKILQNIFLMTKQNIVLEQARVDYSVFENKLNKIISIKCKNQNLNFKTYDTYFVITDNFEKGSEIVVEYSYYLPKVTNIKEEINLDSIVTEQTIALGVASEYCFIQGLFEDAEIWHNKFLEEMKGMKKVEQLNSFVMPKRSWR